MTTKQLKKLNIPDKPGVYFFYKDKSLLYIGKATSLRFRVRSYLGKELIATRGPLILDMTVQATNLKWQVTDSVLEALILEAELIKKHQPKYNTKEKDNKSFNYVCITKDDLAKVLVVRGKNLFSQQYANFSRFTLSGGGSDTDKNLHTVSKKYSVIYGPFTNGLQLKDGLKIIRRIFPFFDEHSNKKGNYEFYRQLKLLPINNYKKNIINLKLFFAGKKKKIVQNLKKEMLAYAKKKEFEKAGEIKKRIFALKHINDVALIREDFGDTSQKHKNFRALPLGGKKNKLLYLSSDSRSEIADASLRAGDRGRHAENFHTSASYRIEAYDIAHMSGKNMVGVMTVVEDGEVAKSEYKKFIIRSQSGANDTGALEEILSRRFRHTEWGMPSLVVMDGGTAQLNVAKRVLKRYQFTIPIVAVVKDDKHKAKAIMGDEQIIKAHKKSILLSNSEAHRFAMAFHKKKRNKNFLQ